MPSKINCWRAKSNWFSLGQVIKPCNYSVGDKNRSCLSNEMMEERKGRYVVGSLEALMGAKPIPGGCGLSDLISTGETKKLKWNNFHHGSVVKTMLLVCFPLRCYSQLQPVSAPVEIPHFLPDISALTSPCLQHSPPSCTCPCAEVIDSDAWKFISILSIFLAQKITQKCTLLLHLFLQVLLEHL